MMAMDAELPFSLNFFEWKVDFSGLAKSKIPSVQVSPNEDFSLLLKEIEVREYQNSI